GVQIFGEELEALAEAAQIVEQSGADFVDLNFGCPVPKIVKKGAGSAVLKDLCFFQKILKTVKRSISIPLSIKVRTGWDQHSRNTHEVAKIAYNEGIIWLTIHGRTRAQAYSGQADWSYIKEIKNKSLIPIIGNGDLIKAKQVLKLKKESSSDGMMIGRGCLKNPWIFQEIDRTGQDKNLKNSYSPPLTQKIHNRNYIDILNMLKFHLENFYDEKMFLLQYKKFSTWFSSGYPDSARFRQTIFQTRDKEEVLKLINEYFHRIDFKKQQETPYEPALMQGHG
ncbi:MAG: tRNA dihydrouridine synthase DusB, partial [Oligoflexia bacterium]|nr:tRNA dihydrouridine synthase DusB [Oligoflexia bacterium]